MTDPLKLERPPQHPAHFHERHDRATEGGRPMTRKEALEIYRRNGLALAQINSLHADIAERLVALETERDAAIARVKLLEGALESFEMALAPENGEGESLTGCAMRVVQNLGHYRARIAELENERDDLRMGSALDEQRLSLLQSAVNSADAGGWSPMSSEATSGELVRVIVKDGLRDLREAVARYDIDHGEYGVVEWEGWVVEEIDAEAEVVAWRPLASLPAVTAAPNDGGRIDPVSMRPFVPFIPLDPGPAIRGGSND